MDPDALGKLRMDLRLQGRRGWIDSDELEKALAELPDVSDKIADSDEGDEAGSPGV
jgi:hypothetical protein